MKIFIGSLFLLLLSGCFLAQDVTGARRPNYPYDAYWIKAGMSQESRRRDSRECGAGNPIGTPTDYSMFTRQQFDEERLPNEDREDILGPMERLKTRWIDCMSAKGYEKLETCSNGRCMYSLSKNE